MYLQRSTNYLKSPKWVEYQLLSKGVTIEYQLLSKNVTVEYQLLNKVI